MSTARNIGIGCGCLVLLVVVGVAALLFSNWEGITAGLGEMKETFQELQVLGDDLQSRYGIPLDVGISAGTDTAGISLTIDITNFNFSEDVDQEVLFKDMAVFVVNHASLPDNITRVAITVQSVISVGVAESTTSRSYEFDVTPLRIPQESSDPTPD